MSVLLQIVVSPTQGVACGPLIRIEPDRTFYPVEGYHQNDLTPYPDDPYIAFNDLPKIDKLQRYLPDLYRAVTN
jgi:peptide methionine sulfoxide reductase MsrA